MCFFSASLGFIPPSFINIDFYLLLSSKLDRVKPQRKIELEDKAHKRVWFEGISRFFKQNEMFSWKPLCSSHELSNFHKNKDTQLFQKNYLQKGHSNAWHHRWVQGKWSFMKVSYKVIPVTFSTKHLLTIKNVCYSNLLNYVLFFIISEKKNYIGQLKHERGLYLRHIQRHWQQFMVQILSSSFYQAVTGS